MNEFYFLFFYKYANCENMLLHTIFIYGNYVSFSFSVVPSTSLQRSGDKRSSTVTLSAPVGFAPVVNGESNSLISSVPCPATSLVSQIESENEGHLNPAEKLQ